MNCPQWINATAVYTKRKSDWIDVSLCCFLCFPFPLSVCVCGCGFFLCPQSNSATSRDLQLLIQIIAHAFYLSYLYDIYIISVSSESQISWVSCLPRPLHTNSKSPPLSHLPVASIPPSISTIKPTLTPVSICVCQWVQN